jgi:NADPH:quinone reductase-like Zn-dependent oxidoreductase
LSVLNQGRAAVYEEPIGPTGVHLRKGRRTGVQAGHVAIAIRAASLNHLDLWLAQGTQRVQPRRVLCADGAGIVADSGDARWKRGDEVVVYPAVARCDCQRCRIGEQVFCESFGILSEHVDGAACLLFQVPAHNVYPKPAALSWEEAAAFPLTFPHRIPDAHHPRPPPARRDAAGGWRDVVRLSGAAGLIAALVLVERAAQASAAHDLARGSAGPAPRGGWRPSERWGRARL